MKDLGLEAIPQGIRVLNAVALQNAVLCADCDVVSDSPHDQCLICGSRSLFNIARVFGGSLPKERASVVVAEAPDTASSGVVLSFPLYLRPRPKVAG
jgi:hypothetical protein